jgi:hypothetical protein
MTPRDSLFPVHFSSIYMPDSVILSAGWVCKAKYGLPGRKPKFETNSKPCRPAFLNSASHISDKYGFVFLNHFGSIPINYFSRQELNYTEDS